MNAKLPLAVFAAYVVSGPHAHRNSTRPINQADLRLSKTRRTAPFRQTLIARALRRLIG